MAPYIQILLVICAAQIRIAVGKIEQLNKTSSKEESKSVSKRQYPLGDFGSFHFPDIALLQAGLSLVGYPYDHQVNGAYNVADQLLHQGILLENHKNVHQPQEIATSPPRNPTKPVYHYTPLPPGTFPAPKGDEKEEERIPQHQNNNPVFLYGTQNPGSDYFYSIQPGRHSLQFTQYAPEYTGIFHSHVLNTQQLYYPS